MKKIIIPFVIACISFAACQKEITDPTKPAYSNGESLELVLTASQDNTSKTSLDGTSVKWTDTDKVTVMYKKAGESTWSTALSGTASSEDSYATATFSVTLDSADTEKEAYAIYPANELVQDVADNAKITIASTQYPSGTDFDGNSDILISKSFIPSSSVTTQFARLGAILKISIDNDDLDEEKLLNLSVEGPNDLAGDVLVGLADKTVKGIVNGSETVTAVYASEKQFELGAADKFVYLIVKPQTWANGSTITISGETENTTFTKDITLDKDIHLNAGHIVPLRIGIPSYVLKNKVIFKETFGGEDSALGTGSATINPDHNDLWSFVSGYAAGSGGHSGRFGTGSIQGSATTLGIAIPAVFRGQTLKLYFKAAAWDAADESTTLSVSAFGTDISLSGAALTEGRVTTVKGAWSYYTLDIATTSSSSSVIIKFTGASASKSRFYLDDVTVYYGVRPLKDAGLSYAISSVVKNTGDDAFTNAINNPNGLVVSYESSDPLVASVNSSTGEVTILKVGSTRITASSIETEEYSTGTAYYNLTVTASSKKYNKVAALTSGKTYLIVNAANGVLMPHPGSSGGTLSKQDVSISSNQIIQTAETEACEFMISNETIDDTVVQLISYNEAATTYYLRGYNAKSNLGRSNAKPSALSDDTYRIWIITTTASYGSFNIQNRNVDSGNRSIIYSSSSSAFGDYSTSNLNGSSYFNVDLFQLED